MFEDDQVIISRDEDANYMGQKLLEEYNKWEISVNFKKTEYMYQTGDILRLDRTQINTVQQFKYLESVIPADGPL